jgi:hypothetical protein
MIRKLEDDLHCLGVAFFENIELNTNSCFGSIGLDCKRPFGNSCVEDDILDIIGWEEDETYEDENYNDLEDGRAYARDLFYEELVMQWMTSFRHDTIKLTVLKRKLCIAKELGLGSFAAYPERIAGGTGLVEKMFGEPHNFIIEPIYEQSDEVNVQK